MSQDPLEIVAIGNLLAAYNLAGDRMRIDALADAFLEDGVLATPTATYQGRAAILAGLSGRAAQGDAAARRPTLVRHNLTTSHIVLTASDTAEGRTYFIVFSDVGPDHMGHYVDRLRKTGDGWRFAHRDVRVDWIADNSLFPALQAAHAARKARP